MTMTPTPTQPPIPASLARQFPEGLPLHLSTWEAGELLRHWGFTSNGPRYVRKLHLSGVLKNVMKPGFNHRFATEQVLAQWTELRG
jgi:hypothetical protein